MQFFTFFILFLSFFYTLITILFPYDKKKIFTYYLLISFALDEISFTVFFIIIKSCFLAYLTYRVCIRLKFFFSYCSATGGADSRPVSEKGSPTEEQSGAVENGKAGYK